MVILSLILALAFAIVAVVFALQNSMIVKVSFFGYIVDGSLALFILLAVAVGIVIGMLVTAPGTIKRSFILRRHRKQIGDLEKSLDEHKAKLAKAEQIMSVPQPPSDFPEDNKA